MHMDVNELTDFDSPIQLHDQVNNELFIIPVNTVTTSEPWNDEGESDSLDRSMYVFFVFISYPFLKLLPLKVKLSSQANLLLRPC